MHATLALGPLTVNNMLRISIIVVTYNTCEITLECLRVAKAALQGLTFEIIVVDNASNDGSVEAIRTSHPEVRIISNQKNFGFGSANNQGMRIATGDLFLLLNSDAFPRPDAVTALCDFLAKNPKAGVVGPRLLNSDGTLQVSCYPFPSPSYAWMENLGLSKGYSCWPHNTLRRVDFVSGACMLVRRRIFEQIGGFDESFFMYAEEADWQRRICNANWEIFFLPDACVTHLGGASGNPGTGDFNGHMFASLDIYQKKHHGTLGLLSLRCAIVTGCLFRSVVWAVAILRPKTRNIALKKLRLHSQLLIRQVTSWKILMKEHPKVSAKSS